MTLASRGLRPDLESAWEALVAPRPEAPDRVDPAALDGMPEPVRRWLTRAVPSGAPVGGAVLLEMEGQIRLGRRWFGFRADQVLRPGVGFVWRPEVGGRVVRFTGADVLVDGEARTSFRLHGRMPVVDAFGEDVAHSAVGRLAAETVVWAPHALVHPNLRGEEIDEDRATVVVPAGGRDIPVEVEVDRVGGLRGVRLDRWNGSAHPPADEPFGGRITSELVTDSGVRIAGSGSVGWGWRTPSWPAGEFFRFRIRRCTRIP